VDASTKPARRLLQRAERGVQSPVEGIQIVGPWLVYPFAGFVLARWARRFSASTHPLARVGVWIASAGLAALAWALASRGMPVGRWGSMSAAFFVASLGVLGACIAASFALERTSPGRNFARLVAGGGLASLAFVPIHYALIGWLEPWLAGALAGAGSACAVLLLVPAVGTAASSKGAS
jgi:cytochrome c oxidase assembly factor CtaG